MWRRTYLLLVLVRLYFALSASYLHPDENFQGPEVIAGQIFSYPVKLTWEFTATDPIRSVFPLWPIYGLPMLLLKWLWIGKGEDGDIPPVAVFWTLRLLMFFLSFVFEDWAIHELVASPRHRKVAVVLVASCYVTWTYQTHTFSNSVETLLVAWALVLIQRIHENHRKSSLGASAIFAALVVFGIFNRITFPAFIFVPTLRLLPHFVRKPFSLISMILSATLVTALAIAIDTTFYSPTPLTWSALWRSQTITPLNNFRYNQDTANLATHGLHPWYQHLISLGLLLGPALVLLLQRPQLSLSSPLLAVVPGVAALSFLPHQEARFLLPVVPLILTSVSLPKNRLHLRVWTTCWLLFNTVLGLLMGMYHQAGIIPTQVFMSGVEDATHAVWWKTYSPPVWLLNGKNEVLTTHDTMGAPVEDVMAKLSNLTTCPSKISSLFRRREGIYVIAPQSAKGLQVYTDDNENQPSEQSKQGALDFERVWLHRRHLNLDDLDFADDGVWNTLRRVIGRRGLGVWKVTQACE